jgi:hypothetical protein
MDIKVTEALPNAFGGADLFGRRRPVIPRGSQTIFNGQIGTQTFSGTATNSETTIVGPRPHSESQVGLAPLTIGVTVGESLRAAGHELRVLRVHSDGSIDYAAK